MTVQTFYPDANPETSSVDGAVRYRTGAGGVLWDTIHDAEDGTGAVPSQASECGFFLRGAISENRWRSLYRGFLLFDTSELPDKAVISSAILSIYGQGKGDDLNCLPTVNIYTSTPASDVDLVVGDYDQVGTTPLSTAISFANWDIFGYNAFTLNTTGLTEISKIGVSKFSIRGNKDVADSPPSWVSDAFSFIFGYFAEQGVDFRPKLEVTYGFNYGRNVSVKLPNRTVNTKIRTE